MFDKLEEKAMVHFFNKFDKNPLKEIYMML